MTVEFLLVSFPEDRDVLADGDRVGVTNHTILISANEYEITLSGTGYVPTSQDVVVASTSIMRPKVVVFAPTSALATVVDAAVRGDAASVRDETGLPEPAARAGRRQSRTA
jgi:hypothetical protein